MKLNICLRDLVKHFSSNARTAMTREALECMASQHYCISVTKRRIACRHRSLLLMCRFQDKVIVHSCFNGTFEAI